MILETSQLLPWNEGKRVDTRNGPRIVHEAEPTEDFWLLWRQHKDALRANGISLNRHYQTGIWIVNWWRQLPKEEVDQMNRNIQASQESDAQIDIPKPDNGMDYFPYQRAGVAFALRIFGKLN